MLRVSPPQSPHAPHSTPGRRWQNPPASSAIAPPPAFPPPDPECSSGSLGRPDPRPPSDGRDWGEAHRADPFLHSLLSPFSNPAFPSAFPPVLPALPSYPAAPGPATSLASMSVHSSFQNCYASSRSISLAVLIAPSSALIIGSLTPSVIGDRPSPSKTPVRSKTSGPHASEQHTANESRFHSSLWRCAPCRTHPIYGLVATLTSEPVIRPSLGLTCAVDL